MGYKLIVFELLKESKYTFIETKAKIGLSRAKIEQMQRKNDAKFSDLYSIANFLDCNVQDLFIEVENCDIPEKSTFRKHEKRMERRNEISALVKQRFPDDVEKIRNLMKISETDVCLRLWYNRFQPRAFARILRLTGDENYLQTVLDRVSELRDGFENNKKA